MKTKKPEIAIVLSVFYPELAQALKAGALKELKKAGVQNFKLVEVPGAVEIPLTAKWLFQEGFSAVVALGALIRGETSHYEACCRLVEQGLMQVQMEMNRPVVFGILMTDNKEQALTRAEGRQPTGKSHEPAGKGNMGREAVRTALTMLSLYKEIKADTTQK